MQASSSQCRTVIRKKRVIVTAVLLPVWVVVESVLFGVRMALFGAVASEIEATMVAWGIVMLVLGGLLGWLYISASPLLEGNGWVILPSALLGMVSLAVTYPQLSETTLTYIARPVEMPVFYDDQRLALAGALDGVAFGAMVGFLTMIVDPHLTPWRRTGVGRYLLLTALIAGIILGSMALDQLGNWGDLLANLIPLVAVWLLRRGVVWWDNHRVGGFRS